MGHRKGNKDNFETGLRDFARLDASASVQHYFIDTHLEQNILIITISYMFVISGL
jgi:hypothetical protein